LASNAQELFTEAGILPAALPDNYTFSKVREILPAMEHAGQDELREALEATGRLKIRGPLATVIFIKHHLEGEHEVEIDRIDEGEEGARLGVLVYAEGEVPIPVESLPPNIDAGAHLRYRPSEGSYRVRD
jgi:hypothetical protein